MTDPLLPPPASEEPHTGWSEEPTDDPDAPLGPRGVPWSIPEAVLVFLASFVVGALVFAAVGALRGVDPALDDTLTLPLTVVIPALVTLAYIALRYRGAGVERLLGRRPRRRLSSEAVAVHPLLADAGYGLAAGVVGFIVINLGLGTAITYVAQELGSELPEVQEGLREVAQDPGLRPFFLLSTVLLGPLAEELYYRGMLFQALRRRLWRWPAIGISGIVFGIVHIEPLAIVITFAAGMVFAWVFARRGTIVAPFVAHGTFNLISSLGLILGYG